MPPEKHMGYAIQWFALALCLAMIYLFVNLKKRSL
jgi:surfeit locus 1 family protein